MKKLIEYKNIFFILILLGLYLLSIINSAWLSDDSFISLTQIVNFHNGDGLVYNFNERVQAFTHPSWFFLISFVTYITGDYYYTIIFISILLSISAVSIIIYYAHLQKNILAGIIGITLLLFSKAFIDYTTSGLENPLSYFLFVVIIYILLMNREISKSLLIITYITMVLLFLNRMDYALILFPIVIYMIMLYKSKNITPILIASLITSIWFIFSIFYFGHFFPNTYYAKLGAGYPISEFIKRGINYYYVQYNNDPITLVTIFTGIFLGLMQKGVIRATSIGLILYLLYFFKSGGDFMQGRFFAVPVIIAVFSIVTYLSQIKLLTYHLFIILIILFLSLNYTSPLFVDNKYNNNIFILGVADERGFYFQRYGLIAPNRKWPKITLLSKNKPEKVEVVCGGLGAFGLSNRDKIHYIDNCALTDPLLSQLPAIKDPDWRTGHQYRNIPTNYREAILDKNIHLQDKALDSLYQDIRIVTQGDLFSKDRLNTIYKINTYNYNINLEKYKDINTSDYSAHIFINIVKSP